MAAPIADQGAGTYYDGTGGATRFDMVVTNVTEYRPFDSRQNGRGNSEGIQGAFLNIDLDLNSETAFKLNFYAHDSGTSLAMSNIDWCVFDFDAGHDFMTCYGPDATSNDCTSPDATMPAAEIEQFTACGINEYYMHGKPPTTTGCQGVCGYPSLCGNIDTANYLDITEVTLDGRSCTRVRAKTRGTGNDNPNTFEDVLLEDCNLCRSPWPTARP